MVAFGKSSGGGRRGAVREAAPLTVHLNSLSTTYQAVLVDISATGARLSGRTLPPQGEELYFNVSGLRLFALVRWASGSEVGLQFYEPLLQAEVIAIRREVVKGGGLQPAFRDAMEDWVLGVAR